MTAQQQSVTEGDLDVEQTSHRQPIQQKKTQRRLTVPQFRLAKFIHEREVAELAAVVQAIEAGDHKQVDAWKAEAQEKGPRIREWSFPKFTWIPFGSTKEPASSSEGVTNDKTNSSS